MSEPIKPAPDAMAVLELIDHTLPQVTKWPWHVERDQGEEGPDYPYQLVAPEHQVPMFRTSKEGGTRPAELAAFEEHASEADALLMQSAPEWVTYLRAEVGRLQALLTGDAKDTEAELAAVRTELARLKHTHADVADELFWRKECERMELEFAQRCMDCPDCSRCKTCQGAHRIERPVTPTATAETTINS